MYIIYTCCSCDTHIRGATDDAAHDVAEAGASGEEQDDKDDKDDDVSINNYSLAQSQTPRLSQDGDNDDTACDTPHDLSGEPRTRPRGGAVSKRKKRKSVFTKQRKLALKLPACADGGDYESGEEDGGEGGDVEVEGVVIGVGGEFSGRQRGRGSGRGRGGGRVRGRGGMMKRERSAEDDHPPPGNYIFFPFLFFSRHFFLRAEGYHSPAGSCFSKVLCEVALCSTYTREVRIYLLHASLPHI
jgi:hypothetical protein